ncbi:GNAT family N-acetyltransferase [Candidatus Parabeggiatoa sp. HSG14]|uniref:GNAT family N-acetyltransferase n=1 Tax=Candidatus Parabeggiatoa sp. HSG14 TaxID=3055593 RepID=UPI0032E43B2F
MKKEDIQSVLDLINECSYVEKHSPFVYWVLSNYFGNVTLVGHDSNRIMGFVSSIIGSEPRKSAYIWQIAVDAKWRRKGIARTLIRHLFKEYEKQEIEAVEFSIAPNNNASLALFSNTIVEIGLELIEMDGFHLSVDNLGWQETHRHFMVNLR